MKYPKVRSVKGTDSHILIVEFDNNEKKQYDVTPLLEKEMFFPLKSTALFKSVRVEQGGRAVSWNDEIDLSEFELWRHGKAVDEQDTGLQKRELDKRYEEYTTGQQNLHDWQAVHEGLRSKRTNEAAHMNSEEW